MTGGGGGRPAPHPAPTLALVTQINIFPGLRGADGTRMRGFALGGLQEVGCSVWIWAPGFRGEGE